MLDELEEYKDEDIFIIGGESIYRMMLPYCDKAYVTRTTLHMMQILIFQIWMRCQSGNEKESEEETYLIWNMYL